MSLFSTRNKERGLQPWSKVVTLAESGKGCDGLFNLYDSLGNITIVGEQTIATLLDGPEKVVRYNDLVIGDGNTTSSLTAANRCKGLVILCDTLTVKNAATLHMTGRGARVDRNDDPFFPFIDYKIPFKVSLDSSHLSLAQALAVIKSMGLAPWDAGTFQHVIAGMFGFNLAVSLAGSVALLTAAGCGASVLGTYAYNAQAAGVNGNAGTSGGMGSGGSGGLGGNDHTSTYRSGAATPYSGGSGSGGHGNNQSNPVSGVAGSPFSGPGGHGGGVCSWQTGYHPFPGETLVLGISYGGGGAGNPGGKQGSSSYTGQTDGGNGVGGKLTIICRGTVNVQDGGKIEANGMPGGSGGSPPGSGYGGGGGSGGGHISIISPSDPTKSGTIQAAGGAGGVGAPSGGNGGTGSVVTKTFTDMGW